MVFHTLSSMRDASWAATALPWVCVITATETFYLPLEITLK